MTTSTTLYDGRATLLCGHVLDALKTLPDNSVHVIITSPPYFGLRAYGTHPQVWDGSPTCEHEWAPFTEQATCSKCGAWCGELGQEPDPKLFIQHLVQIFRECRRVLHPSGTLWVNINDSYNSQGGDLSKPRKINTGNARANASMRKGSRKPVDGMKPKDLVGIPFMLAEALRDDGWYWRTHIPWAKVNGMPSSQKDRPTVTHEHLFIFGKSQRYFYDQAAVLMPSVNESGTRYRRTVDYWNDGVDVMIEEVEAWLAHLKAYRENGGMLLSPEGEPLAITTPTQPYKKAHFAVFPARLVKPMILSGTSEKGVCSQCGAPWERVVEKSLINTEGWGKATKDHTGDLQGSNAVIRNGNGRAGDSVVKTTGWQPTCDCGAEVVSAVVLDPFMGSGTTLSVALQLGRRAIGIDLKPDYIQMAVERIEQEGGQDE